MISPLEVTSPLDLDVVDLVADTLADGGVVVLPTDTVYGLASALEPSSGVERIFELKRRRRDLPIPVLVGSVEQARTLARFDPVAERLAAKWWPGPLTLVLHRRKGMTVDLGGERESDGGSIGIRLPESDLIAELCRRVGPIATTSANRSGGNDPTKIDDAVATFGESVDIYLDGGHSGSALASTVIDVRGSLRVIRAGAIDPAKLGLGEV